MVILGLEMIDDDDYAMAKVSGASGIVETVAQDLELVW